MDTPPTDTLIDWETLSEIISEGKCVLFLGPGATVNYGDKERLNRFCDELLRKHPSEIYAYQKEEGVFVFSKKEVMYDVSVKARKFYQEDYSSPVLEKLAQIPFHFIVLFSPDAALQKEMEKQRLAFKEDFYDVLNERNPELPVPAAPPLIYHLLGTSSKPESIVISHRDLYRYMSAFMGGTRLPQNIKTALNFQNAKNLVFLGVDFDKWYFQIMLNMLGVDGSDYNSYAAIQGGESGLRTIWEKHFRINFVPHHINEFVDRLHREFARKNGLRRPATVQPAARTYRIPNIIRFFSQALSGDDMNAFCISNFDEVYDDFTPEQGKSARINKLIEFVRRQDQFEKLLVLMKEENPVQYDHHVPYYE